MENKSHHKINISRGSATATSTRRRAVASLSPAKQRYSLTNNAAHIHLKPPMRAGSTSSNSNSSSTTKTKSSNLATGSRPPTKPPPLPRRSIAVSQEETCMVSAAGDVLVCRSRDFAQLIGGPSFGENARNGNGSGSQTASAGLGWCDMECAAEFPMTEAFEKSSICNPWLTRTQPSTQRDEKKEHDVAQRHRSKLSSGAPSDPAAVLFGAAGLRGGGATTTATNGSTYQWGSQTGNPVDQANAAFQQLELEVANSTSNVTSPPASPLRCMDDTSPTVGDDEDRVLSMPSFDYSHFSNGGNDMVPVSPMRSSFRSRDPADSAEIDNHLPQKNTQSAYRNNTSYGIPPRPNHSSKTKAESSQAQRSINCNITHSTTNALANPPLLHGVPTFLTSLTQIRIQQVSAHPRGSHVLLISAEQLLFSYGLNDHGQLGIGIKSPPLGCSGNDSHHKYIWTPTIITPLLENGGKAITCAAGESHSLVVVATEGRRILKSKSAQRNDNIESSPQNHDRNSASGVPPFEMNRVISSPPTMEMDKDNLHMNGDESENSTVSSAATSNFESVYHHQLYGFGRNNFMKIGLVHPQIKSNTNESASPQSAAASSTAPLETSAAVDASQDDMEDILLPHRVALHCTVWPEKASHHEDDDTVNGAISSALPPRGIFALAASSEHSAALVRRATGDIELYTWGNAAYHALGITVARCKPKSQAPKIVPVPTLVDRLSYSAKQENLSNTTYLFKQNPPEFPVDVSLGPYSSFVVTSLGRCMSFGISYDGMLGQGRGETESQEPKAIRFPSSSNSNSQVFITSVSAGTGHVIALAKCGTVFTWGKNTDGRLGLGDDQSSSNAEVVASDSDTKIEWTPQRLHPLSKTVSQSAMALPTIPPLTPGPNGNGGAVSLTPPRDDFGPIVQVCAGIDCSMFVTASGKVLSCGKNSGRLGLGEVQSDTTSPTPLFGGLSLWYRPAPPKPTRRSSPSPNRNRPLLKRGMTTPG